MSVLEPDDGIGWILGTLHRAILEHINGRRIEVNGLGVIESVDSSAEAYYVRFSEAGEKIFLRSNGGRELLVPRTASYRELVAPPSEADWDLFEAEINKEGNL